MGKESENYRKNIDERKCPTCGSKLKGFAQKSRHTNGYWNTNYYYQCGCEEHFSPNFMRTITEKPCPEEPLIKEEKKNFKKEMARLISYIGKLKVDDKRKKKLVDKVESYRDYGY